MTTFSKKLIRFAAATDVSEAREFKILERRFSSAIEAWRTGITEYSDVMKGFGQWAQRSLSRHSKAQAEIVSAANRGQDTAKGLNQQLSAISDDLFIIKEALREDEEWSWEL